MQTYNWGELNEDIEVILVGYIRGEEFVGGHFSVYQL